MAVKRGSGTEKSRRANKAGQSIYNLKTYIYIISTHLNHAGPWEVKVTCTKLRRSLVVS